MVLPQRPSINAQSELAFKDPNLLPCEAGLSHYHSYPPAPTIPVFPDFNLTPSVLKTNTILGFCNSCSCRDRNIILLHFIRSLHLDATGQHGDQTLRLAVVAGLTPCFDFYLPMFFFALPLHRWSCSRKAASIKSWQQIDECTHCSWNLNPIRELTSLSLRGFLRWLL